MKQLDAQDIRNMKGREKISCLTVYNAPVARALDAAGLPLLLVGDSVGTTDLGYSSTIPVTLDDMVRHTAAVVRGVSHALVLADMPFMSYQESPVQALRNAGRLLQETGCGAVKLEGGEFRAPTIRTLVQNGIPVCAHVGLTPQSHAQLGYRVQGRGDAAAAQLLADARAVADAGAFAVVLECIPADLAKAVTESVSIPTIGIGAGPHCDGQVLVLHDILGMGGAIHPRFAKCYVDLAAQIQTAAETYKSEVLSGTYPGPEPQYT